MRRWTGNKKNFMTKQKEKEWSDTFIYVMSPQHCKNINHCLQCVSISKNNKNHKIKQATAKKKKKIFQTKNKTTTTKQNKIRVGRKNVRRDKQMDRQTETGQNRNIGYGKISYQTLQYPLASSGWRSTALPSTA